MTDLWAVFVPCGDGEQIIGLSRLKADAQATADQCNGRVSRVSLRDIDHDKTEITEHRS